MAGKSEQKMAWVECGRGLAAFGVLLVHASPFSLYDPANMAVGWWRLPEYGGYGVDFFFILSGFIIYFVHYQDINKPERIKNYVWRRIARIIPMYWLAFAATLIFNQTIQNPAYRASVTPGYLLSELFLAPYRVLLDGPAWTLRHEFIFYTIFILFLIRARIAFTVIGLWGCAILINLAFKGLPPGQIWTPTGILLHHLNLNFLLGIGIAESVRRQRTREAALCLGLVGVALYGAWSTQGWDLHSLTGIFAMKLLLGSALCGLVMLSASQFPAPKVGVALGAMSYSLYILHSLVLEVMGGGMARSGIEAQIPLVVRVIIEVAAALGVTYAAHRLVERPILRWARHMSFGRPAHADYRSA